MTIHEIKVYLKKHYFIVFRYKSEYYTLRRSPSLFGSKYCLIATDALPHCSNSIEELCEQVYMSTGTLFKEAINDIEIFEDDDVSWGTYEAIRHIALVHGNEIHFLYNQRSYWITQPRKDLSELCDDLGNIQTFNSYRDLFKDARIDGYTLEDIWKYVIVDSY